MQSAAVRSTILILALAVAGIPGAFAETGDLISNKKREASAGSGGGHQHYVQSDMASKPGPDGQLAPRLQNLGAHTFSVSTRNKLAQQYMNQGLNLAYGFNHAEARRAFREAARLDPGLAMAYWGQALVLGPNINAMMEPNEEPQALQIVQKAKSLMAKASPRERALISALEKRYSGNTENRTANNKAYAEAMREVHQRFPDDPDVAMLYVESVMDLRPWGYWMRDGYPYEGTAEVVALTEEVMRRHPRHPGALHMYIHIMEPTNTPDRAEKAADALLTLMPAAGHMIHMSSHIYQRVGRYADSMKSNQLAIAADEDYITQCSAQGLYPMMYYPHNIHFLWFAATGDGQSKVAIKSAREVAGKVDDAVLEAMPLTAITAWELLFHRMPYSIDAEDNDRSLLIIAGLFQLSDGIQVVGLGALRGMADVKIPTIITLVAYWVVGLPLGYLLAFHGGFKEQGIWYGLLVGLTSTGILLVHRFNRLSRSLVKGKAMEYKGQM